MEPQCKRYPANLCTLSREEQEAIEQDRADWLHAHQLVRRGSGLSSALRWLATLPDPALIERLRPKIIHLYKHWKPDHASPPDPL